MKKHFNKKLIERIIKDLQRHKEYVELNDILNVKLYIIRYSLNSGLCLIFMRHYKVNYSQPTIDRYLPKGGYLGGKSITDKNWDKLNIIEQIQLRIEVLSEILVNEEYLN